MFAKSLSSIVFMALSLSALTAQAVPTRGRHGQEPADCPAPSIIVRTVTVTAGAASTGTASSGSSSSSNGNSGNGSHSSSSSNNSGKGSNSSSSSNNNGKGSNNSSSSNNNGNGSSSSSSSSSSNNNSGNNNAGSGAAVGSGTEAATTSSSAASTSSTDTSGSNSGSGSTDDPQTSLTLDPRVISTGFEQDGQANATAGQVASRTSSNNFINDCLLTPNLPLTNGKQITTGSCNNVPMGVIPSTDNMPSAKFVSPPNFATLKANTAFTAVLAVNNLDLGHFTNAQANYFAAPQAVNAQGVIVGHTHITVDSLKAIDDTTPTNPKTFAFFKGVDGAAVNGQVSVDLTAGLAEGFYRMCSINTNSNHAPAIVAVAQHGFLDDCTYFTVTTDGQPIAGAPGSTDTASVSAAAATETASAPATDVASSAVASATDVASSVVDTAVASATVSSAAASATNVQDGTGAATDGTAAASNSNSQNNNKSNNNKNNGKNTTIEDGTAPADDSSAAASSAAPVAASSSAAPKAAATAVADATAGTGTAASAKSASNNSNNKSNNGKRRL